MFDLEFVQKFCDDVIDILRSIVRMELDEAKRKLFQDRFKEWCKKSFTDSFHAPDKFHLGHLVHKVDVVDSLLLVLIALMHGIHTNIAWFAVWTGFSPFADRHVCRSRFREREHVRQILPTFAEVVDVTYGNVFEADVPVIVKQLVGSDE